MTRVPRRLPGSAAASVGASGIGSLVGQLAVVAAAPATTRLFEPAEIGVLTVFLAAVGVAYVVAGLRLESAISIEVDDREAVHVLHASMLAVVASAAVVAALAVAVGFAGGWVGDGDQRWAVVLVGPAVLAAGVNQSLVAYAVRVGSFGRIGASRAIQGGVTAAVQVGGGLLTGGTGILVASIVAGWAAASVPVLRAAWRRPDVVAVRRAATRHRRLSRLATPATLVNRSSLELPAALVAWLHGAAAVGRFGLAYRVLIGPANVLVQSTYGVYVNRAGARLRSGADVAALHRRTVRTMGIVGAAGGLAAVLLAPAVFTVVFGDEWRDAGRMCAILAPSVALLLPAGSVAATFWLHGRADLELRRELLRFAFVAIAGVASALADLGPLTTVAALSAAFALGHIVLLARTRRLSNAGPAAGVVAAS